MSDILLTQLAQAYASKETENFIEEYNSPENQELTQEGRRELVQYLVFKAYMSGYNLAADKSKEHCPSCY